MCFFTTYVNYMLRVNLSVSIIAMVEPTGGKDLHPECNPDYNSSTTNKNTTDTGPRYPWSQNVQGLLLGGYFYGYIISSAVAGIICEQLGPWKITLITTVIQGVLTSLTPLAASLHYGVVFAVRFLLGLMGGIGYPAIQVLIAKWSPPAEKSKFMSTFMGNTIGTCVTWPLVGQVTESINWEWGFHVLTIKTAVYCVAFFFLVADSPDKHFFISEEEKNFIEESQQGTVSKKKAYPPYKALLLSSPFWAAVIAQFGNLWGLFLLITGAPKFLVEVMGFNLKSSGILAALPYLARFFGGFFFGWMGDMLLKKTSLEKMSVRRIAAVFSHLLPGTAILLILTAGCNSIVVIALMVISLGMNGSIVISHVQSPQDMAPNFAGTVYGWMGFIGGTTGFIVPAINGALTQKHTGLAEWHEIFLIGGVIYIVCGIWYMIFGRATVQPWNTIKDDEP